MSAAEVAYASLLVITMTEPITCPNPTINLIPTAGPSYSNFSTSTPPPSTSVNGAIYSAPNGAEPYNITTVMAYGGTNIADALDMALSMVPSLQADQTTVLTDSSGSTGIAALSKNNASFVQTTSASQLNNVFQNVARQLVQLVQ